MSENKKQTKNFQSIFEGIKNNHEIEKKVVKENLPPMPTIDKDEPSKYKIAENGEIVKEV